MKKKVIALLVAFVMVITMVPTTAFADDEPVMTPESCTPPPQATINITIVTKMGNQTLEVKGGEVATEDFSGYGEYWKLVPSAYYGFDFVDFQGAGGWYYGSYYVEKTGSNSVTATFKLDDHCKALTIDIHGSGSVSTAPAGVSIGGKKYFEKNEDVTLNPTADTGWKFDKWGGDTDDNTVKMNKDKTVDAYFKKCVYDITFDIGAHGEWLDGTTAPKVVQTQHGDVPVAPSFDENTGYYFTGWSPGIQAATGAATYTATWGKLHEVKFYSGVSAPQKQYVHDGATASRPADPTKPNHQFLGWFYNGVEWNFDNGVTSDMDLYAHWAREYTVSFNSHGGSSVGNQTVLEGEKATEPAAPTRNGYRFDGWFYHGQEWNFGTNTVTSDIELHAKWTAMYTVSFNSHGGSSVGPQSVAEGEKATEPAAPTRNGYRFDGWFYYVCGQPAAWNFGTNTVTSNITLHAAWTKLYTVSFESHGGSSVASQSVAEGEKATEPADPTRSGYRFDGWIYYVCGQPKEWKFDTYSVNSDITLHATWTKMYTVSFDSNGGSSVASQSVPEGGKATEPADPTRTGYLFDGWYYYVGYTQTDWNFNTNKVTSDITLHARWIKQHTVTFDSEHGSPVASQTVLDGGKATEPSDPTRAGYRFDGWYWGHMKWDFGNYTVNCDITLHAHWTKLHTVTFDSHGGSSVDSQIVVDGGKVTEPADPTRTGYRFDGWYFYGNNEWNFNTYTVTKDLTLHAQWTKLYTVTFDSNQGSPVDSQIVPEGNKATKPTDPTRTGYTFDGWYYYHCGYLKEWKFNSYKVHSNVTLIAMWSPISYTVTYDMNTGDGGTTADSIHLYDVEANLTDNGYYKDGYTFEGWSKTADGTAVDFSDEQAVKNLTDVDGDVVKLYAVWKIKTYSVSFYQQDGTTQIGQTQTVDWNTAAALETAPDVVGHTFDKWVLTGDDTTQSDSLTNVKENIKAVASYAKIPYMVTFVDYQGTVLGSATVLYGDPATAPTVPAREGYTFTGWDKDFSVITGTLVVTAQYKINTYTVKFVDHDGTVLSTQTVNYGTAAIAPASPARSGYTFTSWDKEFSKIVSDLTVTAQYKQNVSSDDEDIPGTYDSGSQPFPWLWIALAAVLSGAIVVIVVSQAKRRKKTGDAV